MLSLHRVSFDQFDDYALQHPKGNFHQTAQMARFRELMGWDVHPLLVFSSDTPVGAMILAGKSRRYEITMGPLFDFSETVSTQECMTLIASYVKGLKGLLVEVYPYELYQMHDSAGGVVSSRKQSRLVEGFEENGWRHKGFTTNYDPTANRWVFVKDLSDISSESALLASYRQTTRQTVRKLNAADYTVKKMTYDDLEVVKKLVDSSNDKNNVSTRPLDYYQRLFTAFKESIEFLVVYHKQKVPIAAGVFIYHPNEVVYFMSGADSKYRDLYGGHFLQHFMMTKCIEAGVKRYNFYGISGHFANNPLLVYKAGFRGFVEEYVGGFYKPLVPGGMVTLKAIRAGGMVRRRVGL